MTFNEYYRSFENYNEHDPSLNVCVSLSALKIYHLKFITAIQ